MRTLIFSELTLAIRERYKAGAMIFFTIEKNKEGKIKENVIGMNILKKRRLR